MAEHSVKLPEPRSDDSEDVVWGLSTASALWARGERKDAVVWIRRAAEAAEAAGNPFRASELGMYLPDLEKALLSPVAMPAEDAPPVSDAAPISSFEVILDNDTPPPPVAVPPLQIPALGPVTPAPAPAPAAPSAAATGTTPPTMPPAGAEPATTPPTMPPAAPVPAVTPPTMPPPAGAAVVAAPAPPPAPAVVATPAPAPAPVPVAAPAPAATNPSPVSGRQTPIPSVPTPSTNTPKTSPPSAVAGTNVRPQATAPRRSPSQVGFPAVGARSRPTPEPPAPAASATPAPAPVPAPAAPVPAPAAPVPPPVEEPSSIDEGRSALPPPAPLPSAVTPAAVAPAAAATSGKPDAAQKQRRQVMRTPILDPWSEASAQEALLPRERRRRGNTADTAARPRARMLLDEEDDDILTSAPPLDETLGKKHQGGPTVGGTGLAQAPPIPAVARAAAPVGTPPPLPPRAPGAPPVAGRPPPLPPAVAAPTPMPPTVSPQPPSVKPASQPPPAAAAAPAAPPTSAATPATAPAPAATAAPTSAKIPSPAPPPPAAPTSAKNPTPAPPAPPAPTKTPTQPPPAPQAAPKVPTPPPPDDEEDGTEAPRKLGAARVPTPAPEPPAPPVPSQRAKPSTDAPDQNPPSDVVPTAPRPLPRKSPTIPPAPKLPTGALGKPTVPRPGAPADDGLPADEDARRKFTDTLPSGITLAALAQAEAEARAKGPPAPVPGVKPLFEITKKPVAPSAPLPGAPRVPTPAPRPATIAPKAPTIPQPASVAKPPPPPSVGVPSAPKTKSSLPPPPVLRESVSPPADPIRISNVDLRGVEPFSQLPEEVQRTLVRTAIIEDLVPGESRTAFGAVLVVGGEIAVCAVNLDVPVKLGAARSFVASRGSLAEPIPMRVVGSLSGATISRWSAETFAQALEGHDQAALDCRTASDALQARIGLTLGALAEVDLETREAMLARLEVRVVEPDETITEEDGPMPGLAFVVGGSVEILEGDPAVVVADVRPGDLLFPEALWAGAPAPLRSRAAASGALLLVGERKLALDFAESVPIVGELLSR